MFKKASLCKGLRTNDRGYVVNQLGHPTHPWFFGPPHGAMVQLYSHFRNFSGTSTYAKDIKSPLVIKHGTSHIYNS